MKERKRERENDRKRESRSCRTGGGNLKVRGRDRSRSRGRGSALDFIKCRPLPTGASVCMACVAGTYSNATGARQGRGKSKTGGRRGAGRSLIARGRILRAIHLDGCGVIGEGGTE